MATALVADLSRLLPPQRVSVDTDELARVSGDALAAYRAFQRTGGVEVLPAALVSPTHAEEVAAVAAYASQRGIPLVPRGGGTGVMGGAVPVEGGDRCRAARYGHGARDRPRGATSDRRRGRHPAGRRGRAQSAGGCCWATTRGAAPSPPLAGPSPPTAWATWRASTAAWASRCSACR